MCKCQNLVIFLKLFVKHFYFYAKQLLSKTPQSLLLFKIPKFSLIALLNTILVETILLLY
jgi:hypothetical protein